MRPIFYSTAAVLLSSALCAANAAENDVLSPIAPFVIPSGRPDETAVRGLVECLNKAGFDQFMVYPSTGMDYDYLGDDYFRMVGWFLDEAERRRMKVWLYDEFNWPSGTCLGRVPEENEACLYRELVAYTNSSGKVGWRTLVSRGRSVDNDCLDTNNLEPASANRFIELTHREYSRRFSRHMGTVIRGIFTDEPGHCTTAWRMKVPAGTVTRIPWWSGMEEEYAAATGGADFRCDYEKALSTGMLAAERPFGVWTQIRSERYRRTYFDPIRRWCDENGIVSTGHLIGEGGPPTCARDNGSPINTLLGMSKPGVDLVISATDRRFEWVTLALVQTAVRRSGRPGSAELFGVGPCDLDFTTMRKMYYLCALHGVDTFFQGLWHRSAVRFAKKPAWAMFTSPTQPWFAHARLLNAAAREAAALAGKPAECAIALVYPQKVMGACAMARVAAPDLVGVCRELTLNGFNYELVEETEKTDRPIVFDWDGRTLFERRSGTRFGDFAQMRSWLEQKFPRRLCMRDETGRPKAGYVVRAYADGTAVAVDTSSGAVHFATNGIFSLPGEAESSREIVGNWSLSFDSPSRRRIWFWTSKPATVKARAWEAKVRAHVSGRYSEDGISEFRVLSPLSGVRFVMRSLPEDAGVRVTLDGRPLDFPVAPAKSLVYAYNEICRESEAVDLSAGRHVLKLEGAKDDKMFMPVLWMTENFSEPERGVIAPSPRTVPNGTLAAQGFPSFAGTAVYRAEARLEPGERLVLDTGGAVAGVKFGGRDLGMKGWAPFEWEIPEDLAGRSLPLEISVTTSVRPVFGDENDPDACLGHAQWVRSSSAPEPTVGLRSCRAVR